jgi:hypothetical protein
MNSSITRHKPISMPITLARRGSKTPIDPAMWSHPILALYVDGQRSLDQCPPVRIPAKLFLIPTANNLPGEESDPDSLPKPSPKSDLPDVEIWVERFVIGVVEIWGGRRHPMQLARWCHRNVHLELTKNSGTYPEIPRVRKIYLSEPIEGVCETTVTLRIQDRVRSLVLRFEGVDKRWLCTELALL